jgi:alkyl sulfatase BDS1-like metallo-beta-lactamase superfamily hydrolase
VTDLFALSDNILQQESADSTPFGRVNHELSELDNGLSFVEAFSNSVNFNTDDGLVIVDTSSYRGGQKVVDAIRGWRPKDRFNSLIYSHGHVDHVGGSGAFLACAKAQGTPLVEIYGHENAQPRFDRYQQTNGYNQIINHRQFGTPLDGHFLPTDAGPPTTTYSSYFNLKKGDLELELHHALGETDDHTWVWVPKYKAICAGGFFIWNFPNAGNPQKVQRYPVEWAAAMRAMTAKQPEYFLPAHGLPIRGVKQINEVLINCARVLEDLVADTLSMMNQGARRNDIIHSVRVDPALAAEIPSLAGGSLKLALRAQEIAATGDFRLACHLIEHAVTAAPADTSIHAIRAQIYKQRVATETSLMSKGIFGSAMKTSLENRD